MDVYQGVILKAFQDIVIYHDRSDYVLSVMGNYADLLGLSEDPSDRFEEITALADGNITLWLKVLYCLYRGCRELFALIKDISPLAKYRYILFRETYKQAVYYDGEGPWEVSKFPNEGDPDEVIEVAKLPHGMLYAWLYL